MALSGGFRRLDVIAALTVLIIAPAVADIENMRRIVTKYQSCSIMVLRRAPTTADRPCPARYYCHGGQALCFPCSTCNGSDCRRMIYEPQCTHADPFTYQMSVSRPLYTPACSVASLLRSSVSDSGSKATAMTKVESCDPGCDNLGINGSERCFSGTSCQLACGNDSVVAASWTALCNCTSRGNVATCQWIQVPSACKPAGTQLPTAIAKAKMSERNVQDAERLKSMRDIVDVSDYADGISMPGQLDRRGHATADRLTSLTKRTETVKGPSDFHGWVSALLPLLGLFLAFVTAVAIIPSRCRRHHMGAHRAVGRRLALDASTKRFGELGCPIGCVKIQNISNVTNVITNNCNYVIGVSDSAIAQDGNEDFHESSSGILSSK